MALAETTFRILALCARPPGDRAVSDRLLLETRDLPSWDALLGQAEAHGVEPLLRAHLREAGIAIPSSAADRLTARWMQHAHAYAVRTAVMADVLRAMADEAIPVMLLKGAALAHLVYPDPLHRPMRDVDLLVPVHDVRRATEVLKACGFAVAGPPVPGGHHHSRAMSKTVDEATVTVELHHQVLQPAPFLRRVEYDDVRARAQTFPWAGRDVATIGCEQMLWHVYAHAFAINVTRPAIRLVSVADLVALTERWIDRIDWEQVRRVHGRVWRALPFLHYLTPLSPRLLQTLRWKDDRTPAGVRPVASRLGWSVDACRDVLWPPEWWLCTRYGSRGGTHRVWCRAVEHPVALLISAAQSARRRWPAESR